MKFLYLTLALAGLLSSCRVNPPLDPSTLEPKWNHAPKTGCCKGSCECKSCDVQVSKSSK